MIKCSFLRTKTFYQLSKVGGSRHMEAIVLRSKTRMAIKGGDIAYANMGDPNASIPIPLPVIRVNCINRPLSLVRLHVSSQTLPKCKDHPCGKTFGASIVPAGMILATKKIDLINDQHAGMDRNIKTFYGLNKKVTSVKYVRRLTKLDMKLNDALPNIEVDPETYAVTADDVYLTCAAATTVPLSRNYFIF
nr:urease [Tanacetum cinerariifolium]